MSNSSSNTSPSLNAGQEAAPLDWLLALLREAMEGVMADDSPPLKKANALARLANLYLKTYNAAELEHLNAELIEYVAELEEHLAAAGVEPAAANDEAAGRPNPQNKVGPATTEQEPRDARTPVPMTGPAPLSADVGDRALVARGPQRR